MWPLKNKGKRSVPEQEPKQTGDADNDLWDGIFKDINVRYKDYTLWLIDFDSQNQALSFWNHLTFVSPASQNGGVGVALCDVFPRILRYRNAATLLIAGPVSFEQACEIIEKSRCQQRRIQCSVSAGSAYSKLFESAWDAVRCRRPELFLES
jgi:hypothetical protein